MVQTERRPSQVVILDACSTRTLWPPTTTTAKCSVYRVPIQLEWQKGKVVTETTTEYKEVTDDSDFADKFGNAAAAGGLGFQRGNEAAMVTSSSSSEDENEENAEAKFQDQALKAHNEYRDKHGVAPLKLDKKLCSYAQEWANKLAKDDSFQHRTNQDFGENLYCSWSSNPKAKCPGSKPVDSWYSEGSKYIFGTEPVNSSSVGHFTQVVWKKTEKLGIAKARSKSGKTVVVANYEPAGNWISQYAANVPKPIK